MAGSVDVLDILAVKVRYHAIIGMKHDCVCIVGVKLPRVLSRRGARQHPREFDTNNTHTIMFDPLNEYQSFIFVTRVTRLIHNAGKYLLISIYPLPTHPTHPTHNFTHKNGGNLDTLPGWPKKIASQ